VTGSVERNQNTAQLPRPQEIIQVSVLVRELILRIGYNGYQVSINREVIIKKLLSFQDLIPSLVVHEITGQTANSYLPNGQSWFNINSLFFTGIKS
jgi:hypothetical protein